MTIQQFYVPNPVRTARYGEAVADLDVLSVPYAGQTEMRLTITSGIADAHIHIDPNATDLIAIDSGCGTPPRLRVSASELRLSWPTSIAAWLSAAVAGEEREIEIVLHPAVEWTLQIRGGLSCFDADLASGKLARLDVSGGVSEARIDLPPPATTVPIGISGGVSDLTLRRPADAAVALAVRGGICGLGLDEQRFDAIGGSARLATGSVDGDAPGYIVEISGGASNLYVIAR